MPKKLTVSQTITPKDVLNEVLVDIRPSDVDLCETFGVSRQMLWKYKRGESRPSVERLARIWQSKPNEWEGVMARRMAAAMGVQFGTSGAQA